MTEKISKKQLYDLVWKKPMVEVAKEYGLSDRGLAKLCERNSIPVPPRGYWAKKKAGQKVIRPPLLVLDPKEPDTILLIKRALQNNQIEGNDKGKPQEDSIPEEIKEAIQRESLPQNKVHVPKTLTNPHPIVAKWINEEERQLDSYRRYGSWKPKTPDELERRRRRIISSLLKALEARGFKTEVDRDYSQFIKVKHHWDETGFSITERVRQYRRELTPEEKKDHWNTSAKWRQISESTGLLILRISSQYRGASYSAIDFQETAERPLEEQLNAVIVGFIEKIWSIKKRRNEREEEDRIRRQREEDKRKSAQLLKEEQERKLHLQKKAKNWKKAILLREYIAKVIECQESGSLNIDPEKFARWKGWATAHAEELDPIAAGDPLIELPDPASIDELEDELCE